MIKTYQQQSLLDFLIRVMPELKDMMSKPKVDNKTANILLDIWEREQNKVGDRKFKIPPTLSKEYLKNLTKDGLVLASGDIVEITKKGYEILKGLILNDESSPLDVKLTPFELEARHRAWKKASVNECSTCKRVNNWYGKVATH